MNYKYLPIYLLMTSCVTTKADVFDNMFRRMEDVRNQMQQTWRELDEQIQTMHQSMQDELKSSKMPMINVEVQMKDKELLVVSDKLQTEVKEAIFKEGKNLLEIVADQAAIKIKTEAHGSHYTLVHLDIAQTIKEEKKEAAYSARSSMMQTIQGELELEKAKIEFDKNEAKLIVGIPLKEEKEQKIPVTVKQMPVELK